MKKILTLLAVCSFGTITSSSVVACTKKPEEANEKENIINLTESQLFDLFKTGKLGNNTITKLCGLKIFVGTNKYILDGILIMDKNFIHYSSVLTRDMWNLVFELITKNEGPVKDLQYWVYDLNEIEKKEVNK